MTGKSAGFEDANELAPMVKEQPKWCDCTASLACVRAGALLWSPLHNGFAACVISKIIGAKSGGEAIIITEGTTPALVTELMRRETCRTDY
jgi:hypothetical protein